MSHVRTAAISIATAMLVFGCNTNANVGIGSTRDRGSSSQHTIAFTATAPGS